MSGPRCQDQSEKNWLILSLSTKMVKYTNHLPGKNLANEVRHCWRVFGVAILVFPRKHWYCSNTHTWTTLLCFFLSKIFYWTHVLYLAFWALLIMHGPIFWYFFIVPGVIFVIEKIYSMKIVKLARHGHMYVNEVNLLPSKVRIYCMNLHLDSISWQPSLRKLLSSSLNECSLRS